MLSVASSLVARIGWGFGFVTVVRFAVLVESRWWFGFLTFTFQIEGWKRGFTFAIIKAWKWGLVFAVLEARNRGLLCGFTFHLFQI